LEKVLVTGATGFIGYHLIPELVQQNYKVYALERYMTGRYIQGKNQVDTLYADLNDHATIQKLIRTLQPEYVIHLAAISPVAYSYEHPFEVMETNFNASMNLAEACHRYNPELVQFLAAGTSEEYGIQHFFPIKETADLRPNSPYAVSKVAMDRYLQYLRDAYQFPMTLLRPFNTYGRKRNTHFVVERIMSQMLNDESVVKLGDPHPTRDLMYVSDHVQAYLTCLGNEKALQRTFNFCTGTGTSILDLSEHIRDLTGYGGRIEWNTLPPRPLDIEVLIGDNSKALEVLDWKPKVGLMEGLKKVYSFLKEEGEDKKRVIVAPKTSISYPK
jgi:nucleoside-diphosphate-sugar epimerase